MTSGLQQKAERLEDLTEAEQKLVRRVLKAYPDRSLKETIKDLRAQGM
jgi:hypothetical protein